jgi:hypothetical protein
MGVCWFSVKMEQVGGLFEVAELLQIRTAWLAASRAGAGLYSRVVCHSYTILQWDSQV